MNLINGVNCHPAKFLLCFDVYKLMKDLLSCVIITYKYEIWSYVNEMLYVVVIQDTSLCMARFLRQWIKKNKLSISEENFFIFYFLKKLILERW